MKRKKNFRCDVLDWHTPTTVYVGRLSTTFESTCKRCGRKIMQDSQGNWYSDWIGGKNDIYSDFESP